MATKRIPDGYGTVTPYLIVKDAARALDFYKSALDAVELYRMPDPSGRVAHAEMRVGNSQVMLADEVPDMGAVSPQTLGGAGVSFLVYVDDVDSAYRKAVAAGAKEKRPVQDQFYGDRAGTIQDPFGHQWTLATHVEDVPPDEIQRRFEEMAKQR